MGKVAILMFNFCLRNKVNILFDFSEIYSLLILSIASTLLIVKKMVNRYKKSTHFTLKDLHFLFTWYSLHHGQIFMKLTQFIYIINSLNPIKFMQNLTISKEK